MKMMLIRYLKLENARKWMLLLPGLFVSIFCYAFQRGDGLPKDYYGQSNGIMRIASCQFPVSSSIDENAQWIQEQMVEAKLKGANVVQFPECALPGYVGVDMESLDNFNWNKLYQYTDSIMRLANQLNLWVVLGSIHKLSDGHKPHNSLYLINPEGKIVDRYDKRFCTGRDLKFFTPGNHFCTFEVNGVKCGLLICYDVRFPELYREYRKLGADVIFHSFYNARKGKDAIFPKIMPVTIQARAATNYFYISTSNSSSPQNWPCHFVTPDGLIKNKLGKNTPGILISDIDISQEYYDASKEDRNNVLNGGLNNGEVINDLRSEKREGY